MPGEAGCILMGDCERVNGKPREAVRFPYRLKALVTRFCSLRAATQRSTSRTASTMMRQFGNFPLNIRLPHSRCEGSRDTSDGDISNGDVMMKVAGKYPRNQVTFEGDMQCAVRARAETEFQQDSFAGVSQTPP
ncbi:hypothetical protein FRZ40_43745 [Paraburkholderia azotifigens]|uniref:Uncharacterized protein n=1 Tax=Paraburkholderia azotifigens TaxID=2057004 RepID=A0A5C6V9V8_9BURK|nr:hypothetical protein FRZ40_43745 [Paraburkholderia azotifigens]